MQAAETAGRLTLQLAHTGPVTGATIVIRPITVITGAARTGRSFMLGTLRRAAVAASVMREAVRGGGDREEAARTAGKLLGGLDRNRLTAAAGHVMITREETPGCEIGLLGCLDGTSGWQWRAIVGSVDRDEMAPDGAAGYQVTDSRQHGAFNRGRRERDRRLVRIADAAARLVTDRPGCSELEREVGLHESAGTQPAESVASAEPVITALAASAPGDLVIIDTVERGLLEADAGTLVRAIGAAAALGVRFAVSTNSEAVLEELGLLPLGGADWEREDAEHWEAGSHVGGGDVAVYELLRNDHVAIGHNAASSAVFRPWSEETAAFEVDAFRNEAERRYNRGARAWNARQAGRERREADQAAV